MQMQRIRVAYGKKNFISEWNVIVTARDEAYERTYTLLGRFSPIAKTGYINVLVMRVDDFREFFDKIMEEIGKDPDILRYVISRIAPARQTFGFEEKDDLRKKAGEIVLGWQDRIENRSFHVRMHRRGLKGRMDSREEEALIGKTVAEALQREGKTCTVDFEDPDLIIDIETLDHRAGISLWTREEMQQYPFLRLD
jgi:tRNA(Ser,Leu) C12 N-acetylase TAN1